MKLATCIIGLALFSSCGRGYEVTELYIQKIRDSDKSIFKYTAWSTLNDGSKSGFAILGKNESKGIAGIERQDFATLATSPRNDTLFVIGLIEGANRIPKYKSTKVERYKGLTLVKTNYECSGSPFNLTYNFSGFKETDDKLSILGIEEDDFSLPTSKNELTFGKGNIILIESNRDRGVLEQIEIYAFLLGRYDNSIIDNQTILKDTSFGINGIVHFIFKPTKEIAIDQFSDLGIYKKGEIKDPKTVQ